MTLQVLKTQNEWGVNYTFSFKEVLSTCRVGVYEGDNIGYISDFAIDEQQRNKGYGRMLLKEIECYMSTFGIFEFKLTTDSEKLKRWYEQSGYVTTKIEYTLTNRL